jgi:UPF0755 protein
MNTKKLMITKWVLEIILIVLISFMYYLNRSVATPNVLYIPQGSIGKIITYLQQKKLDVSPLDSLFLRFIGYPQQGWIYIGESSMTHADFLYMLVTAKAAMKDITLIPGETTEAFLYQIAEKLDLDMLILREEYLHMSPIEEGAFVPETYSLPIGISEHNAIRILLNQSERQMRRWSQKIFGTYNKRKWFQYITVASIIQKEAASVKEMPIISSVIQNRLKKGMKLQMDGTLNYGKYSHTKVTARRIKEDRSLYNTYIYKGLPPTPVCNVGFDAIKAAIFPAETDFLYFVKGRDGRHRFSRNYSTHLRNIRHVTK